MCGIAGVIGEFDPDNMNYEKIKQSMFNRGPNFFGHKIFKKDKGFIIVQSDMPFIKTSDINKIFDSIKKGKYLVHALSFKNKIGNPIGFDISTINKFKKIKGDVGAKFLVKKLKKNTNFINVKSNKIFKDFDLSRDFN